MLDTVQETSYPLVRACFAQQTEYTPVWFMRQAGSYIPEHRKLMERYGLVKVTTTPELCTRVTTLPVETLNVDAAVMFADIILPLGGMGIEFHYEDGLGPVIHNPVCSPEDVERLTVVDPHEAVSYILKAIGMVRRELHGKTPVVGFSGGPFTLAGYIVEGRPSRTFNRTKKFMYRHPMAWRSLMEKLTVSITDYLEAQVEAGIDVIQLFDSWVGVLRPADYQRFVLPYTTRIFSALSDTGVPRIHFGTDTAMLIHDMDKAGAEVMSIDWRMPIDWAWKQLRPGRAIQGNLEPAVLLGGWDEISKQLDDVLARVGERPGHIFNLGHRVDLDTPVDNVKRLVDVVHERTAH